MAYEKSNDDQSIKNALCFNSILSSIKFRFAVFFFRAIRSAII